MEISGKNGCKTEKQYKLETNFQTTYWWQYCKQCMQYAGV